MNRIEIHGELGQRFGSGYNMDVGSPIEAFHALDMQLRGFRKAFQDGNYVAIREDRTGKYLVDEDTLTFCQYGTIIHFCPSMEGDANKGAAKTILGAALFVGSLFIPGSTAFMITAQSGFYVQTAGLMIGAALALSGAALLLSPQMKMDTGEREEDRSFMYNGDIRAAGQDFVVPITYGRDLVKPILISTEVVTNQIGVNTGQTYDGTLLPNGTFLRPDVSVF